MLEYKDMYESEKASHFKTELELQKFKKMYHSLFDKFTISDDYEKALSTIVKIHIEHLNHRCIFDLTEEQVTNLSLKLAEDYMLGAEINRFFQNAIENHRDRFNV